MSVLFLCYFCVISVLLLNGFDVQLLIVSFTNGALKNSTITKSNSKKAEEIYT